MLAWLFGSEANRIQRFWRWFSAESDALAGAPLDPDLVRAIAGRLGRIHRDLEIEVGGPGADGRRLLAISAGGLQAVAPLARRVVAAAPAVARWEVRAFRPPKNLNDSVVIVAGAPVSTDEVRVRAEPDGEFVHVTFILPGLAHPEALGLAFRLLDHALGEEVVMSRIGAVEVSEDLEGPSLDLRGLRALLEQHVGPLEAPRV